MGREYFDEMTDYFQSPYLWEKTNIGMELRIKVEHAYVPQHETPIQRGPIRGVYFIYSQCINQSVK